jgi:hypothetical protein
VGDGGGDGPGPAGGLLWSDDEGLLSYSDGEEDEEAGAAAGAGAGAGAPAGSGSGSGSGGGRGAAATAQAARGAPRLFAPGGPEKRPAAAPAEPQAPGAAARGDTLAAVLSEVPTSARGRFRLPPDALGLMGDGLAGDDRVDAVEAAAAAAAARRPGRGEAPAPPPLPLPLRSGGDAAAAVGAGGPAVAPPPQAAALLVGACGISSFEQAAAFMQRYALALGPQHMAVLWCRLRRLLVQGEGGDSGGLDCTQWLGAGSGDGGSGSGSGSGGDSERPPPPPRRDLPPAAMSALKQAAALTIRCGRELPPLGVAAALAALAAARPRGFDPGRLQTHVRRRLKAQLRDAAAAAAARGATPQQLGEALLSLCELGWQLQGQQLARFAAAAATMVAPAGVAPRREAAGGSGGDSSDGSRGGSGGAAPDRSSGSDGGGAAAANRRGGGSDSALACTPAEAGLLLFALARAEAMVAELGAAAASEAAPLAGALFDAYSASLVAAPAAAGGGDSDDVVSSGEGSGGKGGGGEGPPSSSQHDAAGGGLAAAAAAVSVLQALSALPGASALLASRAASLEALLELLQRALPALPGPQLAAATVALHALGVEPWPAWAASLHAALALPGRLQELPGPLACALLRALPELGPAPPGDALTAALARCASGRLHECGGAALAAAPLGLLAARHRPPRYWLDAFWAGSARADWARAPPADVAGMAAAVAWLARGRGAGGTAGDAAAPPGWCGRVRDVLEAAAGPLPAAGGGAGAVDGNDGDPGPPAAAAPAAAAEAPPPPPQQQQRPPRRRRRQRGAGALSDAHLLAALAALEALAPAPPAGGPQAAAEAATEAAVPGAGAAAAADDAPLLAPLFSPDGDAAAEAAAVGVEPPWLLGAAAAGAGAAAPASTGAAP